MEFEPAGLDASDCCSLLVEVVRSLQVVADRGLHSLAGQGTARCAAGGPLPVNAISKCLGRTQAYVPFGAGSRIVGTALVAVPWQSRVRAGFC